MVSRHSILINFVRIGQPALVGLVENVSSVPTKVVVNSPNDTAIHCPARFLV